MKSSSYFAAVLLLASVFSAYACNSTHNSKAANPPTSNPAASLIGTEWLLRDIAGTPALDTPPATLTFPETGRAAGNASCNRFTGSVEITDNSLKFGPLASTRMACMDNGVSGQEDRYLKALGAANRYALENGKLLLYCEGYAKPLRFSRSDAAKP